MIALKKTPALGTIFSGAAILAALASFTVASAHGDDDNASILSTGQKITPTAAPGAKFQLLNPGLVDFPNFVPSGALSSVLSPDQHTLLVLISGHNRLDNAASKVVPDDSEQYIFVFDVSAANPAKKQVIKVPNTFAGIAFNPNRSTAYVVGPYVKQGEVVSEHYTTVNMLRTIEDILGLDHLDINTATQRPMTEVFDLSQREWTYTATASDFLKSTQLPIPANAFVSTDKAPKPLHDSVYWAEKTAEFDFSVEDNLKDPDKFNRITWEGVMGDVPYPSERNGADLRKNRAELLRKYKLAHRPLVLAQDR
jgi:hypothetical protein